jgi:hypothetical protein
MLGAPFLFDHEYSSFWITAATANRKNAEWLTVTLLAKIKRASLNRPRALP